jgi:hypothetical protein
MLSKSSKKNVLAASKEFLYETQKSLQQAWHQPAANKFV